MTKARSSSLHCLYQYHYVVYVQALPLDIRRRVLPAVVIEEKHRLELVKSRDVRFMRDTSV